MSEKLQKLKRQHEVEEHSLQVGEAQLLKSKQAFMFLGGIHAIGQLSKHLHSQKLRALQAIGDQKDYISMGFETFVEFLDSEYSPVTKSQYYESMKLLEAETDDVFNLLNEAGVARKTRHLLATGNFDAISIVGETVKIGDQEADISNIRVVKSLIESYADDLKRVTEENKAKDAKLEKGKEDFERVKRQLAEKNVTTDATPLERANSLCLGALSALAAEIEKATIVDASAFADQTFLLTADRWVHLNNAICNKLGIKSILELTTDETPEERAARLLDEEED